MNELLEQTLGKNMPRLMGTVEDYPSAALNDDPMLYPGVRPETSFLLEGDAVHEVYAHAGDNGRLQFEVLTADGGSKSLDQYLQDVGVASMEGRIPILGYGANMCPASIKAKFAKIGRADAQIVPTVYGQLDGYDVVWSGGPGVNGNFIANLYSGDETADTSVTVGVNFLTREQLIVMHATELSYNLTTVEVIVAGISVQALVYAGVDDILLKDGKPVAVEALHAAGRTLPAATTRELLDEVVLLPEVKELFWGDESFGGHMTADDYVDNTRRLKTVKGAKLERKRKIHDILADRGRSRSYKLPAADDGMYSWANPSTIPTYGERLRDVRHNDVYVLPSSEVEVGSWPDPKRRDSVLRAIGTHTVRVTDGLEERK